jgi:hypothetical protein
MSRLVRRREFWAVLSLAMFVIGITVAPWFHS